MNKDNILVTKPNIIISAFSYSSACVLDVSSFFLYGIERITNKERTGGC